MINEKQNDGKKTWLHNTPWKHFADKKKNRESILGKDGLLKF